MTLPAMNEPCLTCRRPVSPLERRSASGRQQGAMTHCRHCCRQRPPCKGAGEKVPCRHCGKPCAASSPRTQRGLCYGCRRDPAVFDLYAASAPVTPQCRYCGQEACQPGSVPHVDGSCSTCRRIQRMDGESWNHHLEILRHVPTATPGPTRAAAGSPERIATMAARAALGLPTTHPRDGLAHYDWRRERPDPPKAKAAAILTLDLDVGEGDE